MPQPQLKLVELDSSRMNQHTEPASTMAIELGENSVDSIFCMRLLQQVTATDRRMKFLRELHRITRDTLIISLWVDGNFQAWRRQR